MRICSDPLGAVVGFPSAPARQMIINLQPATAIDLALAVVLIYFILRVRKK